MKYISVTLEDIIESKDERAVYQRYLIDKYNCPLVSFTVVMPGNVKKNEMSEKIFLKGKAEIESALEEYDVIFKNENDKNTGPEAFYCVKMCSSELKKLMVDVEQNCKIGRLFDIDVIGKDYVPVSRSALNLPERKCLICDNDSHVCARSRKHTKEELLAEIERVLSDE